MTSNETVARDRFGNKPDALAILEAYVASSPGPQYREWLHPDVLLAAAKRCLATAPRKASRRKASPSFKGYDDFVPAYNAARAAIAAELGENWHLAPGAYRWARVPVAWVRCPVYGRVSTAPRDMRIPVARFWPSGEMPIGPDYAEQTVRPTLCAEWRARRVRCHRSAIDGARMWRDTVGERGKVAALLAHAAAYRRQIATQSRLMEAA